MYDDDRLTIPAFVRRYAEDVARRIIALADDVQHAPSEQQRALAAAHLAYWRNQQERMEAHDHE